MPVTTTMQDLIKALKTGKTRVMDALDKLFGSPSARQNLVAALGAHLADFQAGFGHLPEWAVAILTSAPHNLTIPDDIDHINAWPQWDKDKVREEIIKNIGTAITLDFQWGLWDGPGETVEIKTAGSVTAIRFLSPREKLAYVGPDNMKVNF